MADKKKESKGKKTKGTGKKSFSNKLHTIYENGKAKNKSCPKCGDAIFLAEHKNRRTCGKCNYMEKK